MQNIEATLEIVRTFRREKEKTRELEQQQVSQTQALNQAEQRTQRLQRQLKEIKTAAAGATAEGILQRLEQDIDVAKYIVNDKLPKESETRRKEIHIMEKVLSEGAITPKDLDDTRIRIDKVKAEVNEMVMKRMMKSENDKLVMFRQQAAIVSNKKSTLVEKLNDLKTELSSLKEEIGEKKKVLGNLQGDAIVKEDDFKEYVKNLRVKSTRYKQMKGEMNYLKAESGVVSKTLFILEEQLQSTNVDLVGYPLTHFLLKHLAYHVNWDFAIRYFRIQWRQSMELKAIPKCKLIWRRFLPRNQYWTKRNLSICKKCQILFKN